MSYECSSPIALNVAIPYTSRVDVRGKYKDKVRRPLYVRCGHCYNCVKLKSRQIASRLYHHHSYCRTHMDDYHAFFVTLTYDDVGDNDGKTHYPDVQKFFKKLRFGGLKFSYFVVNEHGSEFGRLHFHLVLYIYNVSHIPLDDTLPNYYVGRKRRRLCTLLEKSTDAYLRHYWLHGITQTGSAANGSFSYVTKYILKDFTVGGKGVFYKQSQCLGYQYYIEHQSEIANGFEFGSGYPRIPAPRAAVKICIPVSERREQFICKSLEIFQKKREKKL